MKCSLYICLLILYTPFSWAHKSSDSYLTFNIQESTLSGQWDIALRDLEYALQLDVDADDHITWGELKYRYQNIQEYAFSRLEIKNDREICSITPGLLQVEQHNDNTYAVINFAAECKRKVNRLDVTYRLFFDLDPGHRGLMQIEKGVQTELHVFAPEQTSARINIAQISSARTFWQFFTEGIWHILIGYDHILFLLCLILPIFFPSSASSSLFATHFSSALLLTGKIITAFTIAHSITLILATLQILSLPSRIVESAIALSVILAAVNNYKTIIPAPGWVIAFVFGLIHGFGFANVLSELSLSSSNLGLALLSFNLGVETGQLAIVTLLLPMIYFLRVSGLYQRPMLNLSSQIIALIASIWFVQRTFDINWISFY